jgi:hypothetical protein
VLHTVSTDRPHVLSHGAQERNCLMLPSWFKVSDTVAQHWLLNHHAIQLCPKKCLSSPSMWYYTQPLSPSSSNAHRRRLWRHKTLLPVVQGTFIGVVNDAQLHATINGMCPTNMIIYEGTKSRMAEYGLTLVLYVSSRNI